MGEKKEKHIRRVQRKMFEKLLQEFTIMDKVKFLFTGDYSKPLKRMNNR